MQRRFAFCLVLGCALHGWALAQSPAQLQAWCVDPLTKVFRDARPDGPPEATVEVARGETATFQIVVRCDQPVEKLRAACERFALAGETSSEPAPLGTPIVRFVGYVPVDRPLASAPADLLRKAPAEFPDPLLEVETVDLAAGAAQPIWITVLIPVTAAPGTWSATATVTGAVAGATAQATTKLTMHVFPAVAGRSRLWVTNWFVMHWPHMRINPAPDSPEYWELLRRYARDMAAHRQTVALISPLNLAEIHEHAGGGLDFDFARFDHWVQIFLDEGVIGRIEGAHIGGRTGNWESPFGVTIKEIENGKVMTATVEPDSPRAVAFYSNFLPSLVHHLREKGWLDKYMQHLADEPIAANAASYRAIAQLVQKYSPELRIIDACHTKDLTGAMNIWVPQLNYLHRDFEHYRAQQAAGDEVWFYTCVYPQGEYANRFIELPLIKTRLLHWINYRYGITGYLHWGYNFWTKEDPFTRLCRPNDGGILPAGDAWIVYPGQDGPLDSIRFEAMRDGIADYELLAQLGEKSPDAALELAQRHILDFNRYDCDVKHFRATRHELLEQLSKVK